jgi:hypothetical protein
MTDENETQSNRVEMRDAIGALTETWRRWGHDSGFGIGIAHGFATLGTIGFERLPRLRHLSSSENLQLSWRSNLRFQR